MITIKANPKFEGFEHFTSHLLNMQDNWLVDSWGQTGVEALRNATPFGTGVTANTWRYDIVQEPNRLILVWSNDHVVGNFHVAIALQYGHATVTGSWVEGEDYINPAMRPVFDTIIDVIRKEVEYG